MEYQKPEIEIIEMEITNIITTSAGTLVPSFDVDDGGNTIGGNGSGNWNDF